jgi:hypothetical protein
MEFEQRARESHRPVNAVLYFLEGKPVTAAVFRASRSSVQAQKPQSASKRGKVASKEKEDSSETQVAA